MSIFNKRKKEDNQKKSPVNNLNHRQSPFASLETLNFSEQYSSYHSVPIEQMRMDARKTFIDSDIAKAIIRRLVEWTIGKGLELNANPLAERISTLKDKTQDEIKSLCSNINENFRLWAESDEGIFGSFQEAQSQIFQQALIDGEVFIQLFYCKGELGNLKVILLRPESIKGSEDGFINGIKYNELQEPIAYQYFDKHGKKSILPARSDTTRRPMLIHYITNKEHPQDSRGTPFFEGVLNQFKRMSDYIDNEVVASYLSSILVFQNVTQVGGNDNVEHLENVINSLKQKHRSKHEHTLEEELPQPDLLTPKQGVNVFNNPEGQKLEVINQNRPNPNMEQFIDALVKYSSSAFGVPAEITLMSFTKSYSASQAALLFFWQSVEKWRSSFSRGVLNKVYEGLAKALVDDHSVLMNLSYREFSFFRRATWHGPSRPHFDSVKTEKANSLRLENGTITRERLVEEQGLDFMQTAQQWKREQKLFNEEEEEINENQENAPTN